MIRKVQIKNYKSVLDMSLDLGRVNVLIGANGCGKSNILEAIALASAAAQNKLDNEFLVSRGIRVAEPDFMRSAFDKRMASTGTKQVSGKKPNATANEKDLIGLTVLGDGAVAYSCELEADEKTSYSQWKHVVKSHVHVAPPWLSSPKENPQRKQAAASYLRELRDLLDTGAEKTTKGSNIPPELLQQLLDEIASFLRTQQPSTLPAFLIFAPENSALRTFQAEGQILPLGIKGEGLFAHLKALSTEKHKKRLEIIKEKLALIDWFENFEVPDDLAPGERSIRIRDRYLAKGSMFDQRSANEGFLFLLFYVTLLISPDTPAFFAIDNIDSSLNPKLCTALLQQLVLLARQYDKQIILTTHNAAILDGIDLSDQEQRLLVVERNKDGHTRVRRVDPPKVTTGQVPVSLSEAFLRGYLGGLPKNF